MNKTEMECSRLPILKKWLTASLFLVCAFNLSAQDSAKVKSIFSEFQRGYSKRDTSLVESFCNKLFSPDISIIGTGAGEWLEGIDGAINLIRNDWANWLNLSIDSGSIKWTKLGAVFLFSAKGFAWITFPNKDAAYAYAYSQLGRFVAAAPNSKSKLLAASSESASFINEIEKEGLDLKYSIRLSGVLLTEGKNLHFRQLVYSFPYPMQRL